jgi:hypothetical protein
LEQKINEWMKPSIGYYNPEVCDTPTSSLRCDVGF